MVESKIERGNIGMRDFRNVPGEREIASARSEIPGALRAGRVAAAPAGMNTGLSDFSGYGLKKLAELLPHFLGIDIAHDDEREIVRDVTRLVILHHLLLGELIVNLDLADHRQSVGMPLIGGREKKLPRHPIGIIHAHGEFAPDDFLFFLYSSGGKVEFIIASDRTSSAVATPSFGTSIQKTVRSNDV